MTLKKETKNNLKPRVVVGVFVINNKEELLLTRQAKWDNKYLNPGGGVEFKEKLKEAAKRELKEETGIKVKALEFLGAGEYFVTKKEKSKANKKSEHIIYFHYKAEVSGKQKIILNNEADKYAWKQVGEWLIDKDLHEDTKRVLKEYFINTDSYKDKYLRALADYQNLVKRSGDEKQEFVKYANEQLLYDILPVYDNLKVSLEHIDREAENNGWATGIKYVVKQFKDFLEGLGVEEIKTVGEKFDHNTMEALKGEGEKVVKEMKAGYKLKGKVVVAAKVEVG